MFFEPLQGWELHHCPGQPGPMPDHSFKEEIFPNIQSEPPLMQLEVVASRPIAGYLGEETNPCLTTPSFQVVVESDKVSLQPPLLQTEQPQLPQSCAMVENRLGKHILHALKLSQRDGAL